MRVLLCCPGTGKFFDGETFGATRETAFDFGHARQAMHAIQAAKWFTMQIVLAYLEPGADIHVNTNFLGSSDEVRTSRLRLKFKPHLA